MINKLVITSLAVVLLVISGCASVRKAPVELDMQEKEFRVSPGMSKLYIYRHETMGAIVGMDVSVDGEYIGTTGAKSYLTLEIEPGTHTIISKAENNEMLTVETMPDMLYFVWQEVKLGLMYARNKLQLVDESTGMDKVRKCALIQPLPR